MTTATAYDSTRSPTLRRLVNDAIEARLFDLHTSMPGEIVKYDASTQLADVQPHLKRYYFSTGELIDLPMLVRVPIVFPRANAAFISFPLKPGDTVLIIFCERSIDDWISQGGKTDPRDARKHHLSDAVAIPGLYPSTGAAAVSSSDLLIKHANAEVHLAPDESIIVKNSGVTITVSKSGTVTIQNQMGELVSAISQLMTDIMNATVATSIGMQPLVMATFATDKAILDSFKG